MANAERRAGDALAVYLRSFGAWTPLASIALMVLQAVIAPLPGSVIVIANSIMFGIWWGALLSWVGGLLGATANFWIARTLGHAMVDALGRARVWGARRTFTPSR